MGDIPLEDLMTAPNANNDADANDTDIDEGTFDVEKAKAKIAKVNSEAKNLRDRLKAAEAKAAEYDKVVESQKTEQQKKDDLYEQTLHSAAKTETDFLRFKAATLAGFPAEQLEDVTQRLVGTTEDELKLDAVKLFETLGASGKRRTTLDGSQGRTSANDINPLVQTLYDQLGITLT